MEMFSYRYWIDGNLQASSLRHSSIDNAARAILRNVPERLRPSAVDVAALDPGESMSICDGDIVRTIERI